MRIDEAKCVGCGACQSFCTMSAIGFAAGGARGRRLVSLVDEDACVDCGVCERSGICPVDALHQPVTEWPRSVRGTFSNPLIEHKETRVPGRGTEEMKTNDVKGTFLPGEVGIGIELGRPGVGAYFRDVEIVAMALMGANIGYQLAMENPVTHFMSDKTTGKLRDDVLNEKATSAIIEGKCKLEKLPQALEVLKDAARKVDTVFSVEVITKVPPEGEVPIKPVLERLGFWYSINSKNNMGLGLPAFKFYNDQK